MRWTFALAGLALALVAGPARADGEVALIVTGSTCTMVGDAGSNHVEITSGGATDAFLVTGKSGTTVNGLASVPVDGVRNFYFGGRAGDDRLEVTRVSIRGSLQVRLDEGANACTITGTRVRRRTQIRGGDGIDTVRVDQSCEFLGAFRVRGEGGNDDIQLVTSKFHGRARVDAGRHDDHVYLLNCDFERFARVEVFAAHGEDYVEIQDCDVLNDALVFLGAFTDRLRLRTSRFQRDARFDGGGGDDDRLRLVTGLFFARLPAFDNF